MSTVCFTEESFGGGTNVKNLENTSIVYCKEKKKAEGISVYTNTTIICCLNQNLHTW